MQVCQCICYLGYMVNTGTAIHLLLYLDFPELQLVVYHGIIHIYRYADSQGTAFPSLKHWSSTVGPGYRQLEHMHS